MKFIKKISQAFSMKFDKMVEAGDADMAAKLTPFFYYFMFFISFATLEGLNDMIAHPKGQLLPRFPLFWAEGVSYPIVISIVVVFFVFASLIGSFFYKHILARMIAFLGMSQFHAFNSSFGSPNHQPDLWLWTSFIFIFLPNIWRNNTTESRKKFLLVFWAALAFVLMTYSMAGIGKLVGALEQGRSGEANAFSIDAAALHISSLLYAMQQTTILGPMIVNKPILGWLPFLGVLFLQLFSFYAAFKPSLHRLWGLCLILFHIGTYLTMRAIFVYPVALIMLLLFSSPFQRGVSWRQTLLDFPVFGFILGKIKKV